MPILSVSHDQVFYYGGWAQQCKARSGAARLVAARLGSVEHGEEGRGDVCRRARLP